MTDNHRHNETNKKCKECGESLYEQYSQVGGVRTLEGYRCINKNCSVYLVTEENQEIDEERMID